MDVKRYDIYMHSDDVQFLRECPDGDYVRAHDFDALLAQRDALQQQFQQHIEDTGKDAHRLISEKMDAMAERDALQGQNETYCTLIADLMGKLEVATEALKWHSGGWPIGMHVYSDNDRCAEHAAKALAQIEGK